MHLAGGLRFLSRIRLSYLLTKLFSKYNRQILLFCDYRISATGAKYPHAIGEHAGYRFPVHVPLYNVCPVGEVPQFVTTKSLAPPTSALTFSDEK
jgi:hypothetical protein